MSDRPNNPRKKLYVFDTEDDGFDDPARFAVVHTSLREARKWLWNDPDLREYCEHEWTNLNAYWLRDVDVSDRAIGDDMVCLEGIKRGVYTWLDDTCPECGKLARLEYYADWEKICCTACEDKLYEEFKAQTGGAS
jgi:hypothetical protein